MVELLTFIPSDVTYERSIKPADEVKIVWRMKRKEKCGRRLGVLIPTMMQRERSKRMQHELENCKQNVKTHFRPSD